MLKQISGIEKELRKFNFYLTRRYIRKNIEEKREKAGEMNMAAATSLSSPKLTFSSSHLQTLCRKFPLSFSLNFSSSLSLSKPLTLAPLSLSHRPSSLSPFRRFAVRAQSENGAEPLHYDFDLFTVGAGSGGVRASRFAANFGASVAVCELPFATISSETTGGVGGT